VRVHEEQTATRTTVSLVQGAPGGGGAATVLAQAFAYDQARSATYSVRAGCVRLLLCLALF
jgi:hypothetical protein